MGEVKYLIDNWQAFLQQIVFLTGIGYKHYCLITYPLEKEHKYKNIDEKMINKYDCHFNRNRKYTRKQKGYANYSFLRYKNIAIVLKTEGKVHEKIKEDDVFKSSKMEPISITITDLTTLEVRNSKNGVSVYLSQDTYDNVLGRCLECLDDARFNQMYVLFNNLNGLPAWSGIVYQRFNMVKALRAAAKRRNVFKQINFNKFQIKDKRYPVKVFR